MAGVCILLFLGSLSFGQESGSPWLVTPELLKSGQLEVVWQTKLPIEKKENLEQLFILSNRIYGLSDKNYFVSLNREDGRVIFSKYITQTGFPVLGLKLYKDELISIAGDKLIEMNPESGAELSSMRLGIGATCPAVRNSSYFYIAGADNRIRVLRTEDKVKLFEVSAANESMITSIVADDSFAVFSTEGGNVISIMPNEAKLLWQFDASDGIVGPIVKEPESLFFASKDTNVYNINILTGELIWKYQTGAILDRTPQVTPGVVYQNVRDGGLVALNRKDGKLIWQLAEGMDLLAESKQKAYVITNKGTLAVMDNKKTKKLYEMNFAGVSRYVSNVLDSKIYIGDKAGRIACIRPVE